MGKGHIKIPKELTCATCSTIFLGKHYLSRYCCLDCKIKSKNRLNKLTGVNKDRTLLRLYGITLDDYKSLEIQQKYSCKICLKKPTKLYVDHCHKTGKVRGLLCINCNTG